MVYAIEGRFALGLPAEAIALERDPKPYGNLFAGRPAIWNAKRWPTLICELRTLLRRIARESIPHFALPPRFVSTQGRPLLVPILAAVARLPACRGR